MQIGVSIIKTTPFRGVDHPFGNTYHFSLNTAVTAPSESIVDEIVTEEKKLHSTAVNFVAGRVWSSGGSPAENSMLFQKVLSGAGGGSPVSGFDKERAILFQWDAGFDNRGNPVKLRKWFHVCGTYLNGTAWPNNVMENTAQIPQATRDALDAIADNFSQVGSTEFWRLCAESGRDHESAPACHPYLEHRQLGDQWR